MKKVTLLLLCAVISVCAEAQKVKYKDLYFLLDTKKYDDAEPFLREFLKDPKNIDHANAHFQMAMIFQEKSRKNDVLLETESLNNNIDSAVLYYQKALTLIDEKEIKRNDEFYQAYKRRDIRTGKFGIKLADVHFDIEKKVEGLKGQKDKITELKSYQEQMKRHYAAAQEQFNAIQETYPSRKLLFLRADNRLIEEFDVLKKEYQEAVANFDKYKSAMGKVERAGYDQSLQQKEVVDYATDGKSAPDYQADVITFWDFSTWADKATVSVREKIFPIREQLLAFDQELEKLHTKMMNDSVSVATEISLLTHSRLGHQLREFDKEPLPLALFDLKIADLRYWSGLFANNNYRDSADVVYQLNVVGSSLDALNEIDSVVNLLLGKNLVEESMNYKEYVDARYGSEAALQAYVKEKLDFAIDEARNKKEELAEVVERSRWLVSGQDSIPLFDARKGEKFVPLEIHEQTTSGLFFSGETPAQGYFAVIEPSRVPSLYMKYEVDTESFNRGNIGNISATTVTDESGQIYFVIFYIQQPEQESYKATVSKIYTSDGLAWSKNVDLAAAPADFVYEQGTGEFVIRYNHEEGTNGELPEFIILDKKGNVK